MSLSVSVGVGVRVRVSVSVSVFVSLLFLFFSFLDIFHLFIIYLIFDVASPIGWSCLRPSSLRCCFPPLGWRCFLPNFREVVPSLLHLLGGAVFSLHPSGGAASLLSTLWVVLPSSLPPFGGASRLMSSLVLFLSFCGWCCLVPSSSWVPLLTSLLLLCCCFLPLPFLGGAAFLSPPLGGAAFSLPPCGWCCFPNLLSGGASFSFVVLPFSSPFWVVLLDLLLLLLWVVLPFSFLWNEMK